MNEVGFGNLNIKDYKSLKAIGRLQFEEKWNSWIPTRTDKKKMEITIAFHEFLYKKIVLNKIFFYKWCVIKRVS